jgi:hypothetical protein
VPATERGIRPGRRPWYAAVWAGPTRTCHGARRDGSLLRLSWLQ